MLWKSSIKLVFVSLLFYGTCFANSVVKEDRKTIIVTGASGELGSEAARLLACEYNLIVTGRNLVTLKQLQEELKANNSGNYEICALDFCSNSSIMSFKEFLDEKGFLISGLALITPRPEFYGKAVIQDEDTWLKVFKTTFTGPLEALNVVVPHLSQHSKVVIVAGTTSVQFLPGFGPSCVIRRMWTTYTKALSHQLGPQGISINALSPGIVLTHFHQKRILKQSEEKGLSYEDQMKKEVAAIPLQRHAKPQEVAQTVRFLLSAESDFINRVNLVIDGGFTTSY